MILEIKTELVKLNKSLNTMLIDVESFDDMELKSLISNSKSRYRRLAYQYEYCKDESKDVDRLMKEVDVKIERLRKVLKERKKKWSTFFGIVLKWVKKLVMAR